MRSILQRISCIGALLALQNSPSFAQSSPAGSWKGEFEAGWRMVDNNKVDRRWLAATLDLQVVGDSLVGTWHLGTVDLEVRGVLRDGRLTLQSMPKQIRVTVNDKSVTQPVSVRLEATLSGDELRGNSWLLPVEAGEAHEWWVRRVI